MNCETVEDFLSTAQRSDFELAPENLILHHAKQCAACQQSIANSKRYLNSLETLEEPELGVGGAQRILSHLNAEIERKSHTKTQGVTPWWRNGFSLGFASASFLCIAIVMLLSLNSAPEPRVPVAELNRGVHEQNISLVIDVPRDMNQANLILEFPADLRWRGLEAMEKIEWPVNLQKGENILELPVSYTFGKLPKTPQVITASIRYGETNRSFALPVSLSTQLSGRELQTEFSL